MERNRAEVSICGTNYVLSGEKSEEKIKEIGKYVDDELRRNSNPNYKCAVLAAVNLAEKLMDNSDLLLKVQTENHQLDNDVKHYISLWENAKKQVTDLKEKIGNDNDKAVQDSERYKALEAKCSDLENAYFDLQRENVSLRNEMRNLERLKRDDE